MPRPSGGRKGLDWSACANGRATWVATSPSAAVRRGVPASKRGFRYSPRLADAPWPEWRPLQGASLASAAPYPDPSSAEALNRHDFVRQRILNELCRGLQAKIGHYFVLVISDRARSYVQDVGDFLHCPAFHEQLYHLALACA